MTAVIALCLTIFGAIIASRLQQRAWERQYRISIEDAQITRALELSDKIAESCGDRLHHQRQFFYSVKNPARYDGAKILTEYREALERWSKSFGYIRANLFSIYGYGYVLDFEREISDSFALIGQEIEAKHRDRRNVLKDDIERRLSLLSVRCYQFTNRLQSSIRDRRLPHFEDIYSLSFDNVDHLDSVYLVKRLYGISTEKRRI